jgi:hypothetical protein
MTIEEGNTPAGTATETQNTAESTETTQGVDLKALHKKAQERNSGNDRIAKALDVAKNGKVEMPETMGIESLQSIEGLNEGGHKGIDYNRVINELPDDAKNLLSNLRADYTRKTQELAQQRKDLEAKMSTLANSEFDNNIRELASRETVELDPYDTDSFNQRIEQEVARRLNDMMQPIREQQAVAQKKAELERFKTENPDLLDYKGEIVQLLKQNENLSMQDAYWLAKSKSQAARLKEMESELGERKRMMADVGLKMAAPARGADMRPPKGLKGYEIYQWIKNNRK